MHELSIAEAVLEIVLSAAREQRASRVGSIRLEIGALSSVDPGALRFCFDAVTRGGIAEAAQLAIDTVPGEAWCMPCRAAIALAAVGEPCPRCGSHQLHVTRGDEMKVKEIAIA